MDPLQALCLQNTARQPKLENLTGTECPEGLEQQECSYPGVSSSRQYTHSPAIFSQRDANGTEHLFAYFSRKLIPREENYSAIEKEFLTIKLATHAFHVHMLRKPFPIHTDHRVLKWLKRPMPI